MCQASCWHQGGTLCPAYVPQLPLWVRGKVVSGAVPTRTSHSGEHRPVQARGQAWGRTGQCVSGSETRPVGARGEGRGWGHGTRACGRSSDIFPVQWEATQGFRHGSDKTLFFRRRCFEGSSVVAGNTASFYKPVCSCSQAIPARAPHPEAIEPPLPPDLPGAPPGEEALVFVFPLGVASGWTTSMTSR